MSSKADQLAVRRATLIARADAQRAQLSYYSQQLEGPLRVTAAVAGVINSLRRSPLAITAAAAVLMRTPWRRLARFPKMAWRGWRTWQLVRAWIR